MVFLYGESSLLPSASYRIAAQRQPVGARTRPVKGAGSRYQSPPRADVKELGACNTRRVLRAALPQLQLYQPGFCVSVFSPFTMLRAISVVGNGKRLYLSAHGGTAANFL